MQQDFYKTGKSNLNRTANKEEMVILIRSQTIFAKDILPNGVNLKCQRIRTKVGDPNI